MREMPVRRSTVAYQVGMALIFASRNGMLRSSWPIYRPTQITRSFLPNHLKSSNCILALRTLVVCGLVLTCLFNRKPEVLKGILEMNFRKPSKIQERALPLLLADPPQNMIAQSQSGTGKTAAFSLNMLSRVDLSNPNPQTLVLAPSRELARQILGVVAHMGQFMEGLKVIAAIPDPTQRNRKFDGHIIVGTPGTVLDMIRRRSIESRHMKILVLDEADNMLDQQGLGDQCKRVKT
jgi:superfamily II DNA/RNA helicase